MLMLVRTHASVVFTVVLLTAGLLLIVPLNAAGATFEELLAKLHHAKTILANIQKQLNIPSATHTATSSFQTSAEKTTKKGVQAGQSIGIVCPVITKTLYRGMRDAQVQSLQQFLASLHFFRYPGYTTYFGLVTERAVQAFQCRYLKLCSGAPQVNGYGVVGPKTRKAIQKVCQQTASIQSSQASGFATTTILSQQTDAKREMEVRQPEVAKRAFISFLQWRSQLLFEDQRNKSEVSIATRHTVSSQSAVSQNTQTTATNSCITADGAKFAHGQRQSRVRYKTRIVPQGEKCQKEEQTRMCVNGVWGNWSGTYTHTTCSSSVERCSSLAQPSVREFCLRFNDVAAALGASEKYKTNPKLYPWGTAYIMHGYIEMYKATKDTRYLDDFITYADAVLTHRDDVLGLIDYTGKTKACWSVADNTGARYCYVVHSAHITYPMAIFVDIVLSDPQLAASYRQKANVYLNKIREVVQAHMSEWRTTSTAKVSIRTDEGFYEFPEDAPIKQTLRGWNAPHNQQLIMANVLILLAKWAPDPGERARYYDMAQRIGRVFWRDLSKDANGAYLWHYWWGNSLQLRNAYEDTGHASLDLEFVVQSYEQGLGIKADSGRFPTINDINAFVLTFIKNIYQNGRFAFYVDGSSPSGKSGDIKNAGRFALLVPYSQEVYNILKRIAQQSEIQTSTDRRMLLLYARLLKGALQYEK